MFGVNLSLTALLWLIRGQRSCAAEGELTNGGEDAGEAEVVDSVEREQVEEELLLLLLTAQEGVTLVQLPVDTSYHSQVRSGICMLPHGCHTLLDN